MVIPEDCWLCAKWVDGYTLVQCLSSLAVIERPPPVDITALDSGSAATTVEREILTYPHIIIIGQGDVSEEPLYRWEDLTALRCHGNLKLTGLKAECAAEVMLWARKPNEEIRAARESELADQREYYLRLRRRLEWQDDRWPIMFQWCKRGNSIFYDATQPALRLDNVAIRECIRILARKE